MRNFKIVNIKDCVSLKDKAASWFSSKWDISKESYLESFEESISSKDGVPNWYIILNDESIIGGIGVIENDFHERKDLSPNVCALYVEEEFRNKGLAGKLLIHVLSELKGKNYKKAYLITDHTSFYERYGWEYLCNVICDDKSSARMYFYDLEK